MSGSFYLHGGLHCTPPDPLPTLGPDFSNTEPRPQFYPKADGTDKLARNLDAPDSGFLKKSKYTVIEKDEEKRDQT